MVQRDLSLLPEMLHFTPLKSLQVRANPPPSAGVCCLDAAQLVIYNLAFCHIGVVRLCMVSHPIALYACPNNKDSHGLFHLHRITCYSE